MVKHSQQFVGNLPTDCSGVFDHFMILVLEGLIFRKYEVFTFSI